MIFQFFGLRKSHSQKIVQQARLAPGSEDRRIVRTPRWLDLPNPPMGQLRGEWRRLEKSAQASSRPKRSWNFEVFVFRILGADTPKRSCTILGPTL